MHDRLWNLFLFFVWYTMGLMLIAGPAGGMLIASGSLAMVLVVERLCWCCGMLRMGWRRRIWNRLPRDTSKDDCHLSGYQPKSIASQIAVLRMLFPGLGTAKVGLSTHKLPVKAEAWFAIPRWQRVAPTYNAAVERVLELIRETRSGQVSDSRGVTADPHRLRQHERAEAMLMKLGDQQEGHDIMLVPAQFGFRHRHRSVHQARGVMSGDEFGLGAFVVGIMLLTHPERLQRYSGLWIDCAGDEYDHPVDRDRFSRAPCFYFDAGRVKFDAYWFEHAHERYGSASGFMP